MNKIDTSNMKKIPYFSRYYITRDGEVYSTCTNNPNVDVLHKLKQHKLKYGLPYVGLVSDDGKRTTKRPGILVEKLWGDK